MATSILTAALAYAAAGWKVFPCKPDQKIPATAHGFKDATTDPAVIRAWWTVDPRRNVAIATGAPGPDILDVDVREDGNGFAAFNRAKRAGLLEGAMAIVRTRSGGLHAYFAGTAQGCHSLPRHHLDFKANGGYVLAPPSVVDGKPYELVTHRAGSGELDWAKVTGLLDPRPSRPAYRPPSGQPQSLDHLVRYVAECSDHVNDRLFWAACRMAEAGQENRLAELIQAAYAAGEDRRGQAERTVGSALRTVAEVDRSARKVTTS